MVDKYNGNLLFTMRHLRSCSHNPAVSFNELSHHMIAQWLMTRNNYRVLSSESNIIISKAELQRT
jgi:hypothetical protein